MCGKMKQGQMNGGETVAAVSKRRQERLSVRFSDDEKSVLDQAAALEGSNTSDFVRQSALKAAHEAIQLHTVARLSLEDPRRFVAALKNGIPPKENCVPLQGTLATKWESR